MPFGPFGYFLGSRTLRKRKRLRDDNKEDGIGKTKVHSASEAAAITMIRQFPVGDFIQLCNWIDLE